MRVLRAAGGSLLALLVAVAPFPTGSQDQAAWATVSASALVASALCLLGCSRRPRRIPAAGVLASLAGLLAFVLIQMAPLPAGLTGVLSPRRAELAQRVGGSLGLDPPGMLALTVSLAATRDAFLLLAACVSAYLASSLVFRRPAALRRLLAAVALGGAALGAWGLVESVRLGKFRLSSTYTNANRFAFLMTMCLFAAVGWRMLAERGLRRTELRASTVSAVVIAAALVLTLSRLGIASAAVAVICLAIASAGGAGAPWTEARPRFLVAGVALAATVLVGSLAASVDPVWQRYSLLFEEELGGMGRLACWRAASRIVRDFPLAGSGAGSFADVFPVYQDPGRLTGFWKYAHNDYLNALSDMGPVGLALVLAAAFLWFRGVWRMLRAPSSVSRVAAFAGTGTAIAALVHSAGDFVLKQPANALAFAVLMGASAARGAHRGRAPASTERADSATRRSERRLGRTALVAFACAGLLLVPACAALVGAAARASAARLNPDPQERAALFERALALDPWDRQTRLEAAQAAALAPGDSRACAARALGILRASPPGEPADARSLYVAGVARWNLGDLDGADRAIVAACELAPAYPSVSSSAGAYFVRRWIESRGTSSRALESAAACIRASALSGGAGALAAALELLGRTPGGEALLERVTPPDPASRLALARHIEKAGRPLEAARILEETLGRSRARGAQAAGSRPPRPELLEALARIYYGIGDVERAVETSTAYVASVEPERRAAAAAGLVARLVRERRPADAAMLLRALGRTLGSDPAVSFARGEFARLTGDTFSAYRAFAAYVGTSPDPEGHLRLAEAARRLGRTDEAELHAAAAARLSPADVRARLLLAELREESGAKALAVEDMRLVLGSRPADIALRRRVGRLLRELGRLDELVELWAETLACDESNAAAHEEMAHARAERGEFELARVHALRALELDPASRRARELVEKYGLGEPGDAPTPRP